jgi:hypothetical protein
MNLPLLRSFYTRAVQGHAGLVLCALAMGVLGVLSGIGVLVDERILLGVPVWLKPAKFFVSFLMFLGAAAWMLGFVERPSRLKTWVGRLLVASASVEMLAIAGQAARGERSHFNISTPFNAAVMAAMGISILIFVAAMAALAILVMRQPLPDPIMGSGIRLGLLVTFVGMLTGGFMLAPKPEQQAALEAGQPVAVRGGHTFGAPEGGPGLPVFNWSTEGGDMRPAHFVGMHALQTLPLLAWFLSRRRSRGLGTGHRLLLVRAAAGAQLGVTLVLTQQALRAQPLTAPDGLSLALFATVLAVPALLALGTLLHATTRAPAISPKVAP